MAKSIRVVATGRGYDGITVREPGDEFDVPAALFDKVPQRDEKNKVIEGEFKPAPSWIKPKEAGKPQAKLTDASDLT